MLTWNKRGRQQSTIFWRNVGNPTAHKDLKGHKNLWLTKFSHLMMWHTHAHLVKHPLLFFHFTTHSASSFFLSIFFLISLIIYLISHSHQNINNNSNKKLQQQRQAVLFSKSKYTERERERENLVVVETYKHKNRMLELKDPAIKLFGKTIPLPLRKQTLTNESSVAEDCSDQNLHSPNISSSSREESSAREREGNKVCMCHVLYRVWISFDMCGLCFFFCNFKTNPFLRNSKL